MGKEKILDTNGINPSQMDLSQIGELLVHNENVQDEEWLGPDDSPQFWSTVALCCIFLRLAFPYEQTCTCSIFHFVIVV